MTRKRKTGQGAPRRSGRMWVALCGFWLVGHGALAQTDEALTIRVEEGDTLRDLAARHLGDPDLWTEILRANGLEAVTDVHPGLELKIPAGEIARANRALETALEVIQAATEEGARLFASDEISEAIRLRDQGVAERQGGRWGEAIRLADLSRLSASQALAIAMEQRDAAAEALLSDRQGWVEGQRPQELVWTDRALNALLIEEEKVRTLSRSTALPGGPAGRRRAGSQQQPAAGGARFARQPTPARDGRPGPDGLPAPASPWPSTPRRRTTAMARSPGSNGISAADGEQVIHVFEAPGVYDVLLTVRDDSGARCGSTSDVARVWVNAPPVAVAGGDRAGFVGGAYDHLLFDASGSRDADGEPLSFLWELGDGVTRSGEKVLHAYAEPGEYAVRLGVADSTGLSCGQTWDEIKVSVQPRQ